MIGEAIPKADPVLCLIGALFELEENTWQILELLPAAKVTAELDNFIAEGGLPKTLDYTNIEDGASAS